MPLTLVPYFFILLILMAYNRILYRHNLSYTLFHVFQPTQPVPNFGFVVFDDVSAVTAAMNAQPIQLYGNHRSRYFDIGSSVSRALLHFGVGMDSSRQQEGIWRGGYAWKHHYTVVTATLNHYDGTIPVQVL